MPSREPLTAQERIDQATLSITNPNVVGSGYIQFPPQRPFEQPIKVQPPTVAVSRLSSQVMLNPSLCCTARCAEVLRFVKAS
jgi:hypothetical protein